jgi:hypothetical protein
VVVVVCEPGQRDRRRGGYGISAAAAAVRISLSTPRMSAATAPIGPPSFNINDREDVREFFSQVYQASNSVPEVGRPFRGPAGPVGRSDARWRRFVLVGLPDIN